MSKPRDILLLCLLGLLACLPGIDTLPVIDRDEARYAQSVVQMVETGDYIDIRFQDEPRYKKPVGAYWAQAAAIHLTGQADDVRAGERPIWAQRLPSVVGALLAVVFTYLAGIALFGRRAAFVGAAFLAVSVSLAFEAHQAKTDALLAGASAAVLYGIAARKAWAVWLGIGAGILIKGPVIVAVAGLALGTLAVIERSGARVRELMTPLPILVALAITLPWFVAIGIKTDGAFFAEALGRDFGAKIGSAQETHGGWPGYYLLTTLVMFWPGVIALPLALVWAWRERKAPAVTLLLAWLVPMWIVLELVPTKLPHYTLPLYPALALLCGAAAASLWAKNRVVLRVAGLVLFTLVGLGLAYFGLYAAFGPQPDEGWIVPAVGTVALSVMAATALLVRKQAEYTPAILTGAVTSLIVLGLLANSYGTFGLTDRVVAQLEARSLEGRRVVSPDYREPSLVYRLGTDTGLSVEELRSGDVLLTGSRGTQGPVCEPGRREPFAQVEGAHYAKGVGRYFLTLHPTDGCDAAALDAWRAREAARRTDSSG